MQQNLHTASAEDLIVGASSFHKQGKLAEAIPLANEVIRRFSSNPDGWMLLSQINLQRGAIKDAVDNIQKAISLSPQGAKYYAQLARCFTLAQQKHLALEAARRAVELKPEDAESLDAIAAILTLCDEQAMARPLAEKAVAMEPENAFYRYNLAALQRMLGDIEAAEDNCDKAIALNPDDYRAYFTRSDLRKQNDEDNHIEEIEALLAKGANDWRGEMMLNFALAKEYDDILAHDKY
jgi:tetratricopeptide (TPR) repeat protein